MNNNNNNNICAYEYALHWNLRGFRGKKGELDELISEHNPIIISLNELKLDINYDLTMRNFHVYKKNRKERKK